MVEAKPQRNLLVKLQISSSGSPVCKRVMASDYATLMVMAAKMAARVNMEPEGLRYDDGHDWVMIEDDMDLEFAYDFADGKCKRNTQSIVPATIPGEPSQIVFNIKLKGIAESGAPENEEMREEAPSVGQKKGGNKGGANKVKGIPRKALKNLISKEFERTAKDNFEKLLKSEDLPAPEMTAEEAQAVHEGVECDSCSVNPIVGPRYKCSVRKNYDVCAPCEDRLEHEHPYLKITKPGGAPDVMITMLPEEQPQPQPAATQQEEAKGEPAQQAEQNPMQMFQKMMGQFGGRGGHGGRGGRGGCGGMGGHGGRGGMPWKHMMKQFMGNFGNDGNGQFNPEEFGKKMGEMANNFGKQWQQNQGTEGQGCGQGQGNWGGWGKQGWKHARAIIKRKPEDVISLAPGMTAIVEIEVFNDTYWPWKAGCMLTFSDEQPDGCAMPLDIFQVPIEQEVKGKSGATFAVPLTMGAHVLADPEKVYEMNLTFRGPRGASFGEIIPIKVKCVLPQRQATEVEVYKLAIKLHEQLSLGSLDDCIKAVREQNGDEAESIKALQRKE